MTVSVSQRCLAASVFSEPLQSQAILEDAQARAYQEPIAKPEQTLRWRAMSGLAITQHTLRRRFVIG